MLRPCDGEALTNVYDARSKLSSGKVVFTLDLVATSSDVTIR